MHRFKLVRSLTTSIANDESASFQIIEIKTNKTNHAQNDALSLLENTMQLIVLCSKNEFLVGQRWCKVYPHTKHLKFQEKCTRSVIKTEKLP